MKMSTDPVPASSHKDPISDTTLLHHFFGTYQNVAAEESANFMMEMNLRFPPSSVQFDKSSLLLTIGETEDDYVIRNYSAPAYYQEFKFRLNQIRSTSLSGSFQIFLTKNGPSGSFMMVNEVYLPLDVIYVTYVFDDRGVKLSNNAIANRYYRRVFPLLCDGVFQYVTEKAQSWDQISNNSRGVLSSFLPSSKGHGTDNSLAFSRHESGYCIRITSSGEMFELPFVLDLLSTSVLPNGESIKCSCSYTGGKVTTVHVIVELINGKEKLNMDLTVDETGITAVYSVNDVKGWGFFRRLIPNSILGTYESLSDSDDFITLATAAGLTKLIQKTKTELTTKSDKSYLQSITTGSDPTVTFAFTLGTPLETVLNGRAIAYTYNLYMQGLNAVLTSNFKETDHGPLKFDIISVFSPDGYVARYFFGDKTAIRRYIRTSKN